MNILASYNWLTEYLKSPDDPKTFAKKISMAGDNVEYSDNLAERFDKMVVGKILEISDHPNADKLKVVKTDIGTKEVDIVCGGSNLVEGHRVLVTLPGSKVRWHGEGDLIELQEAEIRGVKSHGMIATPAEIGFEKLQGKDERMIWDLEGLTDAKPGTALVKALEFDDIVFDIEVTTNRPDAMNMVGLAREAGAAGAGDFIWEPAVLPQTSKKADLSIEVKDADLCPRYQAVVIDGVKVGPSPWWLQKRLLLSGHRPINNLVDITNYILHELGQPLHTFDADKLEGDKVVVRKAKKGEKIKALDGEEYELGSSMLVIADAKKPVAVAGVMGGEETGTTEETTRVVIECATFDPVSVRRTSRALTLYSDSQGLFEKGLSTESTEPALARAIELIQELAGGEVVSEIYDERAEPYKPFSFAYDASKVNGLVGIEIPEKKQLDILKRLGFDVSKDKKNVRVPYWRDHDIEASVDFVEEIARMYGYDNIPAALPVGTIPTPEPFKDLVWESKVKQILRSTGCTELYSYNFVSEKDLEKFQIPTDRAVEIKNPLSEEWTYMRPALHLGFLNAIEQNQHQISHAALFELGAVHHPMKDGLPKEHKRLLIGVYDQEGASAFREAKGVFERLMRACGVEWSLETGSADEHWHPGRVAQIHGAGGVLLGEIGEVDPTYAAAFGIDVRVTLVDIDFDGLVEMCSSKKSFTPIPEFQDVRRDLACVVDERIEYQSLHDALKEAHDVVETVSVFDVYQGKGVEEGKKSMAFHIQLRGDHTLSGEEADQAMDTLKKVIEDQFGGIIR